MIIVSGFMGCMINWVTCVSFFILVFFLTNAVNRQAFLGILLKTGLGGIVVVGADFMINAQYEELWLLMVILFLLWWTGQQITKHKFKLSVAIILSYLTLMLSTTVMTIILIKHAGESVNHLIKVYMTWPLVILTISGQILIAVIFGLMIKFLYEIIQKYVTRYGVKVAGVILVGLALLVGIILLLFREFNRLNLPIEYLASVLGTVIVLMVLIGIGVVFFAQAIIRQNKLAIERENQKSLLLYVNQLETNYHEIRKFRHDIVNALLALETIISEYGDTTLIADFNRLMTHYNFDTIQNKEVGRFQVINNAYIKGLVFSKYIQAYNRQIEFNLNVTPNLFDHQQQYFDELRILGIFLDNALEAIDSHSDGQITVTLFKKNQQIIYEVQNTIFNPVAIGRIFQSGYSTKGPGRGLGLATAREITAARSDSRLIFKQNKMIFTAALVVALEETHD